MAKRLDHAAVVRMHRARFVRRLLRNAGLSLGIVGASLALGVLGYHFIAGLAWVDALLNASMILSGMGPVDPLKTSAAKVFASCYAIFSGVVFITTAGILVAPVLRHVIHQFHLDQGEAEEKQAK